MKHPHSCPCSLPLEERIKFFYPQITSVCRANRKRKRDLLSSAQPCFFNFVSDCSRGILQKHIQFPVHVYKKLRKFRDDLLILANRKTSNKNRKALLVDKNGGFLPLILPALASALFGLLGNVISKKLL